MSDVVVNFRSSGMLSMYLTCMVNDQESAECHQTSINARLHTYAMILSTEQLTKGFGEKLVAAMQRDIGGFIRLANTVELPARIMRPLATSVDFASSLLQSATKQEGE